MKLITFLSAGILILLSACAGSNKATTPSTPLYETKWLLKKIKNEEVATKAFIKFNELKKSAGGNGSCNTFGSTTTINSNELSFKNIFSTKMYCEEVQKTENDYLSHLGKANKFEIKGNTLLLYNDKDLLLEFTAE